MLQQNCLDNLLTAVGLPINKYATFYLPKHLFNYISDLTKQPSFKSETVGG